MKIDTIFKKDFSIYNQTVLNRLYKEKIAASKVSCYYCYRKTGKMHGGCNSMWIRKKRKHTNWKLLRKTKWKPKEQ